MRTLFRKRFSLAALFVAALSACAGMSEEEPKQVTATIIRLSDTRFSGPPLAIVATNEQCGRKEVAAWESNAGTLQIMVAEAEEGCILYQPLEEEEALVHKFEWLNKSALRFEGPRMKTDAPTGEVWGRRFRYENRACYFFRHAFEAHHTSIDSEPTSFIMGFFCARPGQQLGDDSIHRLISGISIGEKPMEATVSAALTIAFR